MKFASEVNLQYLRFQLTEHRLTDPRLGDQLRDLLWRSDSPLVKGPFVSISRSLEEGRSVHELVQEKVLHPKMETIIPFKTIFKHQEEALRAVETGKDVLITTSTGSGKTESFLYPILNRILRNRDKGQAEGVTALIVYPMNALATDQLERLRDLLVGTGISFGMYTGETPEERADATYTPKELPQGTSRDAYRELVKKNATVENQVLHPHEERYTRKAIQESPPRILLTNTRMLEYLLTRAEDLSFLREAPLEFLVIDEAHTNSGAMGAEVALLLRRVKAVVKDKSKVQHLAASATIVDKKSQFQGQRFFARLVGTDPGRVHLVWESYQDLKWHSDPVKGQFPKEPEGLNERTLRALDLKGPDREAELDRVFVELTNHPLPPGPTVEDRLHEGFLRIDFARAIYETGATLGVMEDRVQAVWERVGRGTVRDADAARWEYLTYLALGAAAIKDGTPILRPKLHYFIRGLEDAVVVFEPSSPAGSGYIPHLYLSREKATEAHKDLQGTAMFEVRSCPRCGQHHYVQWINVEDLPENQPLSGGTIVEGGAVYHPDPSESKTRVWFTDRVLQESGEYGTSDNGRLPDGYVEGAVCRFCGAIHTGSPKQCGSCEHERNTELVPILVLNSVNKVSTCPACGYGAGYGQSWREDPFRALRENTATNIYVLSQDMLASAESGSRKLIIFADNRQDAAFQAGSMRDKSRIFRLRQLVEQYLLDEKEVAAGKDASIEAVVDRLIQVIGGDEALARFVAPEVFEETLESKVSSKRAQALKRFLSVQVLNELTRPYTDRKALEALGKLHVRYVGIDSNAPGVASLAQTHGRTTLEVALWLESLLDLIRRRQFFTHDLVPELFAKSWNDKRNDLVANRYVPESEFRPGGVVLRKEGEYKDSKASLQPFIGRNSAIEAWAKIGLGFEDGEARAAFLKDVWTFLVDKSKVLVRLHSLQWGNGSPIPGTSNVVHLSGKVVALVASEGRWECRLCKRLHGHPTPHNACTGYRCGGTIERVADGTEPRDYDLVHLDRERDLDSFVMAEEHSAQVPKGRRQEIERRFKRGQGVNTLVATPTLELGVDIGPLDMILMRNVPPNSAHYWQRAGRAGRRNRMAVTYTYARDTAHDLHYYRQPEELMVGSLTPPKFNLRNPVMLRKHIHAMILTHYQEAFRSGRAAWVTQVFPKRVGDVLFEGDRLRGSVEGMVDDLRKAIQSDRDELLTKARATFQQDWPDDRSFVAEEVLGEVISSAPSQLQASYQRVWNRLRWAQLQAAAIGARESEGAALSDEEVRFQARCRALIRAFNPKAWKKDENLSRADASYTLKVLATEGFLPGYATSSDSVTASAHQAYSPGWERFEFDLSRNATVAIREHVPGSRIYANGGKYQISNYLFPADEEVRRPIDWLVHPVTRAVKHPSEVATSENVTEWLKIKSAPLVDSTLQYISHVDAQETTRFRMACHVSGVIRGNHSGGTQYQAAERFVEHRKGQEITLVNLGATRKLDEAMGYPICLVCGAVRSPFEREGGIEHFVQAHEKFHGVAPENYALHTNATVDGLLFKGCKDITFAASMAEGLRLAASTVLEIERDDLDWFVQATAGDEVDLFLYDAMPGGSGLLHQVTEQWERIVEEGRRALRDCPGACTQSCYRCLRTYYNQFWHENLSREVGAAALAEYAKLGTPTPLEPARSGGVESAAPTNKWEKMLETMVREEWGFSGFHKQGRIELPGCKVPYTKPDLIHEEAKIAMYLDGSPHFEIQTLRRDRVIRHELEDTGWLVLEVPIGDMENLEMMRRMKERIGHRINRRAT